jgi:hypothetical protein
MLSRARGTPEGQLSISYVGAKQDESDAKVVITDRKLFLAAVRDLRLGLERQEGPARQQRSSGKKRCRAGQSREAG